MNRPSLHLSSGVIAGHKTGSALAGGLHRGFGRGRCGCRSSGCFPTVSLYAQYGSSISCRQEPSYALDRSVASSTLRTSRCKMISSAKYVAAFLCLVLPAIAQAQSAGIVECPRSGDYVYLYSSMTTLDVRITLQCGEQLQITGRYDRYFGVRTAKGEIGYVPVESLLLLKDKPGAKAPQSKTVQPTRERTPYDAPARRAEIAPSAPPSASDFTLRNGTPIRLKLGKTISSATAHVGDVVDLKVMEEVGDGRGTQETHGPRRKAGLEYQLCASEGRREGCGPLLPGEHRLKQFDWSGSPPIFRQRRSVRARNRIHCVRGWGHAAKETGLSGRKGHFQRRAGPPSSKSVPAAPVLTL